MTKKLRPGLVEPSDIPIADLPSYMGDTYRGYMLAVRERLQVFEKNRVKRFGYAELDREFFALQLRMLFELTAFAVITFQQRERPIAKSRRTQNHALEVLKLVSEYNWIQPVDPNYKFELENTEYVIPNIKTFFSDSENFKDTHGKLGALLHEQQRPRKNNKGKLTLEKIFYYEKQFRLLLGQHILTSSSGEGWYINMDYPGQPNGLLIVKITDCAKIT